MLKIHNYHQIKPLEYTKSYFQLIFLNFRCAKNLIFLIFNAIIKKSTQTEHMSLKVKISELLGFNLFSQADDFNKNKILATNLMGTVAIFLLSLFGIFAIIHDDIIRFAIIFSTIFLLLINIIIARKTMKWKLPALSGTIIVGLLFIYLLIDGGTANTGHFWIITYPIVAVLLLGTKRGSIVSIVAIAIIAVLMSLPDSFSLKISGDIDFNIRLIIVYLLCYTTSIIYEILNIASQKSYETKALNSANEKKIKEEFISQLSHQLRTPLNNITMISNILNQSDLDAKQQDFLNTIIASTNNLVNVVNNIGKITAIEIFDKGYEKTPFDLMSTLTNATNLFRTEDEKVSISISSPDALRTSFIGEPIRLKQILLNILENIILNNQKDNLDIKIKLTPFNDNKTNLNIKFDIEVNKSLFNHPDNSGEKFFYKNDEINDIQYIDLNIAKKLIEIAGDKLVIISEASNSVFSFALPFRKTSETIKPIDESDLKEKLTIKKQTMKSIGLHEANILLVEDNLVNQKIVNLSLKKLVKNIDIANNGKEALDKFATTRYDLILMDVQMPIMDGITATKKIREIESSSESQTPIIAITANALAGDKENCIGVGMNDYISKPFQIEDLLDKMRFLLSGEDA